MKLRELYELAVKKGIEFDPRGQKGVKEILDKTRKEHRKLKGGAKKEFDIDRLASPYSDTRILYGSPEKEINKILVGIDMEVGELLLADRLNERNENIDLVLAHHPEGRALAGLYHVMHIQSDILNKVGISLNVAQDLMKERIGEVERSLLPINHTRSVDIARILGIPFMCCHTPADNCVNAYLSKLMDRRKPKTVNDVIGILKGISEYRDAARQEAGPKIIKGEKTAKAGKIFIDMTGGTEGSKRVFARLSQAGISTLVCMHLSEEHFKRAKEEFMNVVIAGHISSDNLGLNLLLDEIEKKNKLNVITCSGFKRFKR